MKDIKIVVDTGADLPEEYRKKYDIGVLSFLSIFGEETFVTGVDITNEEFFDKLEESEFTKLFEEYNVKKVIYGHLHGKEFFDMGLRGIRNDVEYILASSDYIDFKPIKIME